MYTESFKELYHGTSVSFFEDISHNGFRKSEHGWCGQGVYFYDVKSKAWWSANRTCRVLKSHTGEKHKPGVIFVNIPDIAKEKILDLRDFRNVNLIKEFYTKNLDSILVHDKYSINTNPTKEDKTKLRSAILDFYSQKNDIDMVIAYIKQEDNNDIDLSLEFANLLGLVVGAETIYCVREITSIKIIKFIQWGGSVYER